MTIEELAKMSSVEVYIGWEREQQAADAVVADAQAASLAGRCKVCDGDAACVYCVDNGLYPTTGYMDGEQAEYYAPDAPPAETACANYYTGCECGGCIAEFRRVWPEANSMGEA